MKSECVDEEKIDMKGSLKRKATRPIQMTKIDESEVIEQKRK